MKLRMFAPAIALAFWALANAVGVDPDLVRVMGPGATAVACAVHIREEVRVFRALLNRGRRV
jgi:hypothetical protein